VGKVKKSGAKITLSVSVCGNGGVGWGGFRKWSQRENGAKEVAVTLTLVGMGRKGGSNSYEKPKK
jgi:hypothetical protein